MLASGASLSCALWKSEINTHLSAPSISLQAAAEDREAIEDVFRRFSSLAPAVSAALGSGNDAEESAPSRGGDGSYGAAAEGEAEEEQEATPAARGDADGDASLTGEATAERASSGSEASHSPPSASPSADSTVEGLAEVEGLSEGLSTGGFGLREVVLGAAEEIASGPHPRGEPWDWLVRKARARASVSVSVSGTDAQGSTRRAAVLRQALESILSAAPEAEEGVRSLIQREAGRIRGLAGLDADGVQREAERRALLKLLRPLLPVLPQSKLRGPHDRWEGQPEGPSR